MLYIQLIGILAFCILILSFYKKNNVQILTYQITSNFAYAVHYFLLGGLSGAFSSAVGIFRNMFFIKSKKNKNIICIGFLMIYIAVTIVFYEDFYSLYPLFANSSYLFSIKFGDKKSLLIGGIFNAIFWLLYSIFVLSYSCIVTESILIISNTIQLINFKKIKRVS